MQSNETGLKRRNREFFENFRQIQASGVLMAASQANFNRNPNQLRKREGTFLLFGRTGDVSARTGHVMSNIRHLQAQ
jgi:hypothetical protein